MSLNFWVLGSRFKCVRLQVDRMYVRCFDCGLLLLLEALRKFIFGNFQHQGFLNVLWQGTYKLCATSMETHTTVAETVPTDMTYWREKTCRFKTFCLSLNLIPTMWSKTSKVTLLKSWFSENGTSNRYGLRPYQKSLACHSQRGNCYPRANLVCLHKESMVICMSLFH